MMDADQNFECILPASSRPALWRAMRLISKINQIVLLLYAIRGLPLHEIMLPQREFWSWLLLYVGLSYIIAYGLSTKARCSKTSGSACHICFRAKLWY
jgi:hypothetical protein